MQYMESLCRNNSQDFIVQIVKTRKKMVDLKFDRLDCELFLKDRLEEGLELPLFWQQLNGEDLLDLTAFVYHVMLSFDSVKLPEGYEGQEPKPLWS